MGGSEMCGAAAAFLRRCLPPELYQSVPQNMPHASHVTEPTATFPQSKAQQLRLSMIPSSCPVCWQLSIILQLRGSEIALPTHHSRCLSLSRAFSKVCGAERSEQLLATRAYLSRRWPASTVTGLPAKGTNRHRSLLDLPPRKTGIPSRRLG